MRPVYYVPETKPLPDLLQDLRTHRIHIAIVQDEYGEGTSLMTFRQTDGDGSKFDNLIVCQHQPCEWAQGSQDLDLPRELQGSAKYEQPEVRDDPPLIDLSTPQPAGTFPCLVSSRFSHTFRSKQAACLSRGADARTCLFLLSVLRTCRFMLCSAASDCSGD